MKRILFLLAIAALALPATALGKGPAGASIDGPGTGGGINISGNGESGGTPLGDLTEQAGFFPATFGQEPDPMMQSRPKGNLGRKYTINYTVPGPNNDTFHITQDVYPYANPPVTYTKPGQRIFDRQTRGGWYQSYAGLKDTLVAAGLPKIAPTGSTAADDDGFFSTGVLGATAVALALLLGTTGAFFLRRRSRPAPAA
jgi:hypothetical protein